MLSVRSRSLVFPRAIFLVALMLVALSMAPLPDAQAAERQQDAATSPAAAVGEHSTSPSLNGAAGQLGGDAGHAAVHHTVPGLIWITPFAFA